MLCSAQVLNSAADLGERKRSIHYLRVPRRAKPILRGRAEVDVASLQSPAIHGVGILPDTKEFRLRPPDAIVHLRYLFKTSWHCLDCRTSVAALTRKVEIVRCMFL